MTGKGLFGVSELREERVGFEEGFELQSPIGILQEHTQYGGCSNEIEIAACE